MQDLVQHQNNDFFMTKYLNIQITVNIDTNGKNKCKCTMTNVKSMLPYTHIKIMKLWVSGNQSIILIITN